MIASAWSLPAWGQGKTLFEGYYRILSDSTGGRKAHVGFVVHRYTFNQTLKRFTSTYYIRTNASAGNITESLHAVANDKFHPISYQFTQTIGQRIKIIDAKFAGLTATGTISDGQKAQPVQKSFNKGSFFSTFLGYLMLQRGMITDTRYNYTGIAEEELKVHQGDAYISKEMVNYRGHQVFRVLNVFKGSKFISFVNAQGEVYGTRSPAQSISTELVADPATATRGFAVNTGHLRKLFGEVPVGRTHSLAPAPAAPQPGKTQNLAPNQGKQSFPAGQGVQIKAQPTGSPPAPVPIGSPAQSPQNSGTKGQ